MASLSGMGSEQQPTEDPYLVAVRVVAALVREYATDPDPYRFFRDPELREITARTDLEGLVPVLAGLCYDVMSEFARYTGTAVDKTVDTFMFALEANAGLRDLTRPPDDSDLEDGSGPDGAT